MSLSELIYQYVVDESDVEEAAQRIFEELLSDPEELARILEPILKNRIMVYLRQAALKAEKGSVLDTPSASPVAERLEFLKERFYVPGDGFVSWAAATVTQHEKRITFLNVKINGLQETANRHIKAIDEINNHGVETLGEVYGKPKRTRKSA